MALYTKRIYDEPDDKDGARVLVDRLWPRGVSKQRAALDEWAKDIAPSSDLRTWFGHAPQRFDEFSVRYINQLENNPALPAFLEFVKVHSDATLLYAAKDPAVNHAIVLKHYLQGRLRKP